MPINAGMFTSARGDWKTPGELLVALEDEFGKLFDVSDTHNGTFDALHDPWPQPWYCNPPYGREIGRWTHLMRGKGIALLPARTDTRWFNNDILLYSEEVRFIKGRLHFSDAGPAPFPSMIAVFGMNKRTIETDLAWLAGIIDGEEFNRRHGITIPDSCTVLNTKIEDLKRIQENLPEGIIPELIVDGKLVAASSKSGIHVYSRQGIRSKMSKDGIPVLFVEAIQEDEK